MKKLYLFSLCLFCIYVSIAQSNVSKSICSGGNVTINPSDVGLPSNTLFSWTSTITSGIATNISDSSNSSKFTQTLYIPFATNTVAVITYAVVPSSGNPFTIVVTVNPTSMIVDATNITPVICSGGQFYANVSGVPSNTQFTWTSPTLSTGVTLNGGGAQSTPQSYIIQSLKYVGLAGTSGTATYTVTPSVGGCTNSNPFSFTVTVNPSATAAPTISNASTITDKCSNTTVSFTASASGVSATNFAWTRPVTYGISQPAYTATNTNVISETLNNTNTTQVPVNYFFTMNYAGGACQTTQAVTIKINPVAYITNKTVAVCSGSPFTALITESIPDNTRYTWANPTGSGSVTGASAQTSVALISQTLTNTTANKNVSVNLTYTVTPTTVSTSTCTGTSFQVAVTVNPISTVSTQQTAVTCSNIPFNISTSAFPPNTNFSWALAPTISPNPAAITGGAAQISPQNSISQTLVNTTTVAATATYVVTPITGSCIGPNFNTVVTVNPAPNVNPVNQSYTICSGASTTITQTGVPNGTLYNWSIPTISPSNAITGFSALTNQASLNQTLTNTTNAAATATYTVLPIVGSCSGNPFSIVLTVNPAPNFVTQTAISCSNTAFEINPPNAPTGTTYTWTLPNYAPGVSGGGAQTLAQSNISQILINSGASAATATYTVTASANGCQGVAFNAIVTVNPLPIVANFVSNSCSGVNFTAKPTSSLANTTYTWTQPVSSITGYITGGTAQTIAQSSISDVLINTTAGNASAIYTVTPYAGGCTGNSFTLTQTVNPTPSISSIRTEVCSQSAFSVSHANVPFGTTYSWSAPVLAPANSLTGSSAQASPLSVISQNLTNTTNTTAIALYTVTPNTGACIGATFTVEVSVKISALITNQSVATCSGQPFDLKPSGVPIGTTYTWVAPILSSDVSGGSSQNADQANISQTLLNNATNGSTGTATYVVTPNSNGCLGASFNLVVTIKPLPIVTDLSQSVCSGVSFNAIPNSNVNNTGYTWTAPIISPTNAIIGGLAKTSTVQYVSQTLTNITNAQASATYTVTPIANGCVGNTFILIETVNPTPSIETQTTTVCSNTAFNVAPTNVPIGTTTLYTWSAPVVNPAGSLIGENNQSVPLTIISQTLINNTNAVATATYNVTPIAGTCQGLPFKVVVNVTPRASLADISTNICSGSSFSVIPSNAPSGTLYTWSYPTISNGILGASLQTTPQTSIGQQLTNSNTTVTSGTANYTVTPITNGCVGNNFNVSVTITSNNTQLTSNLSPPAVCSGSVFNYVPMSNSNGTAFSWSRAITSGISNLDINSFGTINETLINTTDAPVTVAYTFTLSTNGCVNLNKQIVTVVVNPAPKLSSSITPPAICSGSTFNYAATSNTFNVNYSWARSYVVGITEQVKSGTGNISETLSNPTYNAVTVPYIFNLTANGCTNSQTIYLIVNPVLTLPDMNISACSGSPVNVSVSSAPSNTLYTWSSPTQSNGISGGSPQLLVPQSTISQTLLNNTNGIGTAVYTVTPSIPATYTTGCQGRPFTLTVLVNPVPTLTSPLIIPSVCSNTEFNYTPTSNVQGAGFTWIRDAVNGISNIRTISSGNIKETLLDTTTSPVQVIYKFTVSANGCSDTSRFITVTLNASPVIKTQYLTICSGTAFLLPNSLMPSRTTYNWTNPLVIPNASLNGYKSTTTPQSLVSDTLYNTTIKDAVANYTIQPTGNLCNIAPFNLVVTVKPVANISSQQTSICSGSSLYYIPSNIPAGTSFTWQNPSITPFGVITGFSNDTSGQLAINQTLINKSLSGASATYQVTPFSNGCLGNSFPLTVQVNPIPTASVTSVSALCRNVSDSFVIQFTGTSPWAYTYANSKNGIPITVTGNTKGFDTVKIASLPDTTSYTFKIIRVRDAFCSNDSSTVSLTQQLYPLPYDSVIATYGTQLCVGKSLPLTINNSRNAYQWFYNDTLLTANASGIIYNASLPGIYKAAVTNNYGCTNKTVNSVQMVQIFKNPSLSFKYDSSCIQLPISFTNLTDTSNTGSLTWKWVFNNTDSANGFNTKYLFNSAGSKTIRIIANSAYCGYSAFKDSTILIRQPENGIVLPSVSTYKNTSVPLQARILTGSKYTYKWVPSWGLDNPNISNPNFNFNMNQTYYVKIISEYGCTTTDTLQTYVFENGLTSIFVPKSFSPNGDGINDKLYVYLAGIQDFHFFKVFNKYGQLMFETRNQDTPWDGRTNGTAQPLGAYAWIAEGVDINGKTITQTGSVMLLR
jgi:gliding motility-associated-like protein